MSKPSKTVLVLAVGALLAVPLVVMFIDAERTHSYDHSSRVGGGRHRRPGSPSHDPVVVTRRWGRIGMRAYWSYRVASQSATGPTGPARLEAFGSRICSRV